VKQFTQCTNCQQWYVRTYTTAVEIYQSDSLHCTTVWCLRCIDDAERRSQPHDTSGAAVVATPASDTVEAGERPSHVPSSDIFQHFMQEHLQLMDRALYDDETILIPSIEDFMERCRLYQPHLERPEQLKRLIGHLQYWETFLKALNS
jgi:hypothetical protein